MADEPTITIIGNLTADPELRFTQSGRAVCNFTIASTPRTYDKQAGEWKDGNPLFIRASLWQETAENAAESLTKGMRVVAHGKLVARSYETKDGRHGTSYELEGAEVGPSLRYATAQVTRKQPRQAPPQSHSQPAADPWGGQPQAQTPTDWGTPQTSGF